VGAGGQPGRRRRAPAGPPLGRLPRALARAGLSARAHHRCRAHHPPAKLTLSAAELEARRTQDEQDAAIFTTAAFAGLRLGELRALRWRDADFDLRVVHIRRSYSGGSEDVPKSGRVRAVPMVDQVALALEDLSRRERFVAPGDLVFPGPEGEVIDDSALRRRYYAALRAADIEHLRFHDLRRTLAI
jgi:integrase